jgi:hypothetical protein
MRAALPVADEASGRGLALLGMLAAAWGVKWHGQPEAPEAKSVWFELRGATAG